MGDFAFWLAIGLTSLGLTFGPIGRPLARWIGARSRPGQAELDQGMSERLADVDGMARRLMELEERVDFAERMLVEVRKPALQEAEIPPARCAVRLSSSRPAREGA